MLPEERDADQLRIIVKYLTKAQAYAERFGGTYEEFSSNEEFQDVVAFCFIQTGEAVGRLSDDFHSGGAGAHFHPAAGRITSSPSFE